MKEERYHIALDDYEHGVVIRALNDTIKVGYAPKKKFKVIERKESSGRESR